MSRKISLYINDTLADLGDDSFILMNYAFDDLSNPAVVKNSYSHQVALPGTPNNVAIFGGINHSTRIVGDGSDGSGISFDPMLKAPFVIYNELNCAVQSGYVRLDQVVGEGSDVSFKVTLFGGLGSLFYGLDTKADGTRMTLGDLVYYDEGGTGYGEDDVFGFDVYAAWRELMYDEGLDEYGIINFVPMYNGVPEDFDAKTAYVKAGVYDNLLGQYSKDGVVYRPKGGTTQPYLVAFGNSHTEWELNDLRNYLQRPAIKVDVLLTAIVDASSFVSDMRLVIDESARGALTDNLYMTLPMLPADKRSSVSRMTFGSLLEGTISPSQFLIGFAKVFGLVFVTDVDTVTLMSRDVFFSRYSGELVDLDGRVDRSKSMTVKPVLADKRFFSFSLKGVGADAAQHRDNFGVELGSVKVDTAYQFNDDTTDIFSGAPFKVAAVTQDRSLNYVWEFFDNDGSIVENRYLPISARETLTATMYEANDPEKEGKIEIGAAGGKVLDAVGYYDWLPKAQAVSADGKAEDGAYMLLRYTGVEDAPEPEYDDAQEGETIYFEPLRYYITGYDAARISANGGKDCWDLRNQTQYLTALPAFTNVGLLMASTSGVDGIYAKRHRAYIAERYDKDTRMLTCRINHLGLDASQDLLRHFYYYDGAVWVINAVRNLSITTYDTVEVDLIRVGDMNNYTNGQS